MPSSSGLPVLCWGSWWPGWDPGWVPRGGDEVLGPLLLPACVAQTRSALALMRLPFSLPGHWEHLPGRRQLHHVRLLHPRSQDPTPLSLLLLHPSASRRREPGRPSQGPCALQERVSEAQADPKRTSKHLSCFPPSSGRGCGRPGASCCCSS